MELILIVVVMILALLVLSYPIMKMAVGAVEFCLEDRTTRDLQVRAQVLPSIVLDPFGTIEYIDSRPRRILTRIGVILIGPVVLPIVIAICAITIVLGWVYQVLAWLFRFIFA